METPLKVVLAEKAELLAQRGDELYSTEPTAPAVEAIRTMSKANVGCLLILDRGQLVGIFSERDVLHAVAADGLPPKAVKVGDVMTTDLFTVPPSMTVEEALVECTNRRVRHLPVVEDGQLLGLLSIGDLVRFVVQDKDQDIAHLMEYIHGQDIQV
jgi:CBS domain-containing protein